MGTDTKQLLVNRFKSFLWRAGAMVGVALLAFVSDNIGLLHVSPAVITVVGLVVGELTKLLNQMTSPA